MERVDRFELLGLAGEGGMGAVWRARDPALDRVVALKLLRGHPDAESLRRFAREASAAGALQHPHVVRVHEAGVWQGQPFLVMDWVEGEPLRALLRRRGRLEPAEARRIASAVADALAASHALGIVHRDVKPENVLMTLDGRPLLADFGLAQLHTSDRLTRTGEALGTPGYMAPEQATADRERVGPASDVFALGVLLYELLAGVQPFSGSSTLDLLRAVVTETPRPLSRFVPGIDPGLESLTLTCLEKDPARRPSAAAVRDALRAEPASSRGLTPVQLLALGLTGLGALGALAVLALAPHGPAREGPAPASSATRAGGGGESVPEPPPPASRPEGPGWFQDLPQAARPPAPFLTPAPRQAGVYLLPRPDGGEAPMVWIPAQAGLGGFYLAQQELSWAEYRAYLAATGQTLPGPAADDMEDRRPDARQNPGLPAALTWLEAQAYCRWAGARLPTLAEWLRAAALEGGRLPPAAPQMRKRPTGAGPLGPSGCRDLADNSMEWLEDTRAAHPDLEVTSYRHEGEQRLLAGGSFTAGPALECRTACPPWGSRLDAGLRLARDATPPPPPPTPPTPVALSWQAEVIAFRPTPAEQRPVPRESAGRPYAELARSAYVLVEAELPDLQLRFESGPGSIPALQQVGGGLPDDWFALRADTQVELPPGEYELVVEAADDGVRVWKDEQLVIDCWRHGVWKVEDQPQLRHPFKLERARQVSLRVEYVELYGGAQLRLSLNRQE